MNRPSAPRTVRNGRPSVKLLVLRSQAGDGSAFADLMRRYQQMVWAYAYARCNDSHLADDVVQDSFIDAYRKIGALRTPEAFPGWLRSIARTRLDHLARKRGPELVHYREEVAAGAPSQRPEELFERGVELSRVRSLLHLLSPAQREAASLCYVDGCDSHQVAEFLGISPGAVRKRLSDARKRFSERYTREEVENMDEMLHRLFRHHVSPETLQRVNDDPSVVRLKGERRELTTMVVDAAGMYRLFDRLDPETSVRYLNEYLSAVYEVVIDHNGFMDKIVADAVLAFWGAPFDSPTSPEAACRAALAIHARVSELSASFRSRQLPELRVRIGINTGSVVIAGYGPAEDPAYTPMGASIYLADQMESAAKEHGVTTVITEHTRAHLGDEFRLEELGAHVDAYSGESVRIYSLLG